MCVFAHSGPRGTEVTPRSFTSSDASAFSTSPILNLIAGSYTLSVAGATDHTGSYGFRLSDLASVTAITPGTAVSDSLNPANETNLYRFSANAGDTFYFDLTRSSSAPYWRLIDPYGGQVWFNSSFSSVAATVLPFSGSYTLLIEGGISNTTPVTYTFNAQRLTNTTAALTLGAQVNGAITQAGQQGLYTFTLTGASQLYFDSLTNDSGMTWSLSGPCGVEVSSRTFTASDDGGFSSSPILNLIAGSYTLTVAGSGNHLGGYSFRLSDLAAATPLTPGTTVTGTLGDPAMAAAQTHVSSTAPITYSSGSNGAAQFSPGNNSLPVSDSTSLMRVPWCKGATARTWRCRPAMCRAARP